MSLARFLNFMDQCVSPMLQPFAVTVLPPPLHCILVPGTVGVGWQLTHLVNSQFS